MMRGLIALDEATGRYCLSVPGIEFCRQHAVVLEVVWDKVLAPLMGEEDTYLR